MTFHRPVTVVIILRHGGRDGGRARPRDADLAVDDLGYRSIAARVGHVLTAAGRSPRIEVRIAVALGRQGGEGYGTRGRSDGERSEEHTSELQSLMHISYAVFCLKKKKK